MNKKSTLKAAQYTYRLMLMTHDDDSMMFLMCLMIIKNYINAHLH